MLLDDNHTMQIQWDGSLIEKGFKDIEARLRSLNDLNPLTAPSTPVDRNTSSRNLSGAIDQRSRIREENKINDLRVKAEQQIARLRKINSNEANSAIRELTSSTKALDNAQKLLAKSTNKNDKEFIEYEATLRDTSRQLRVASKRTTDLSRNFNAQKFAADGLGQSLRNLGRSWISVFAIIGGVNFLKNTAAEMENIGVASLLASGSAKQSAEDLAFVRDLTEDLGLRFKDTAKAFATFNVAALSSGVSGEKAREVFINISEALAGSATSAESAKLAFLGFRQMMSGSVVQAQEINQIVDQMPAFYGAAKEALVDMGYEVSQVADDGKKSFKDTFKIMGVDAKKFVDLSSRIMSEQARQTGAIAKFRSSISAEETRMINARDVAIDKMASSGLDDLFKNIFGGLANLIKAVTPALTALGYTFGRLAEYIALPFRMLGKLAEILGVEEGEGITRVLQLLSTLLIPLLISGLIKMSTVLGGAAAKAMGLSAGLFSAAAGGFSFANSLIAIRGAVTLLMKRFLPLFLLMEGLTFLYDKFAAPDVGLEVRNIEKSVTNKTAAAQSRPTFNVENLQVTSGDGANARDIAEDVVREFRDMAHSQFPLV